MNPGATTVSLRVSWPEFIGNGSEQYHTYKFVENEATVKQPVAAVGQECSRPYQELEVREQEGSVIYE